MSVKQSRWVGKDVKIILVMCYLYIKLSVLCKSTRLSRKSRAGVNHRGWMGG